MKNNFLFSAYISVIAKITMEMSAESFCLAADPDYVEEVFWFML